MCDHIVMSIPSWWYEEADAVHGCRVLGEWWCANEYNVTIGPARARIGVQCNAVRAMHNAMQYCQRSDSKLPIIPKAYETNPSSECAAGSCIA